MQISLLLYHSWREEDRILGTCDRLRDQLSAAPQQSSNHTEHHLSPWWSGSSHGDKEGREGQVEHAEFISQMSLLICSVNCISSDLAGSV